MNKDVLIKEIEKVVSTNADIQPLLKELNGLGYSISIKPHKLPIQPQYLTIDTVDFQYAPIECNWDIDWYVSKINTSKIAYVLYVVSDSSPIRTPRHPKHTINEYSYKSYATITINRKMNRAGKFTITIEAHGSYLNRDYKKLYQFSFSEFLTDTQLSSFNSFISVVGKDIQPIMDSVNEAHNKWIEKNGK